MATYAIGDVQGCYEPLMRLLDKIKLSYQDRLWFCGDLVNRGPQSLETLRYIQSLGERARVVLGNHDLHLLAVAAGVKKTKTHDTLNNILNAPDKTKLLNWLKKQPLFIHDPQLNFSMSHAGFPPCWSLQEAKKHSKEIETLLQSPKCHSLLSNLYGNTPTKWHKELDGWTRARLIVNFLTRMRYLTKQGDLALGFKGHPNQAPENLLPWYTLPNPGLEHTHMVFGHWAALEGQVDHPKLYALDTGCVWGNQLSALRLEDRCLIQVDAQYP